MENVDRVLAMLHEAGIETSVTNRRAWAGRDYRRASYANPPDRDSWPQIWIVKAEDQPKARALLREAGIEPATRFADDLAKARTPVQDAQTRRSVIVWRIRLLLVGLIALLILLRVLGIVKFY